MLPCLFAIAVAAFAVFTRSNATLVRTFVGAGIALVVWSAVLFASARRSNRTLVLEFAPRKQHWMQACAQGSVLLYWGWYVPLVYTFLPFVGVQLLFAYAIDSLLSWSRRDRYALGFGPFPVVLSTNLFLWFRLDWFHWQLAMIAVGFLAKELIRWKRDGRLAHIFNPSSFPLAVASLALLLTGTSDVTYGSFIANTQSDPPNIYLLIFLVSLPGQILFGVARMTLVAVVTMYTISLVYFAATGTYLFIDSHIPLSRRERPPEPTGIHRREPRRCHPGVDSTNHKVHQRHGKQLVVERRCARRREHHIEHGRKHGVHDAKTDPPQLAPR
jgi:hypothetical protein